MRKNLQMEKRCADFGCADVQIEKLVGGYLSGGRLWRHSLGVWGK
jgi:hypothetical protein